MKVLYQNVDVGKLTGRIGGTGSSRELLLLVLALPETQGLQLWNDILSDSSFHRLPITVLLAHANEAAQALGMENGSCETSGSSSLAQVKKLLRSVEPKPNSEDVIKVGDLIIDPATYSVSRPGKTVRLTYREFRLIYYLASHPNRFFTREQLLSTVWESGHYVNARVVDVYIGRVRTKVEADPENPILVKTLRGAGYVFDAPP